MTAPKGSATIDFDDLDVRRPTVDANRASPRPTARAMRTFFVVASPARSSPKRSSSVVRAFLCGRERRRGGR